MRAVSTAIFTALLATGLVALPGQHYDLLIRNARVLDGTGNPWFPADIGVQGGRIVDVGQLWDAQATLVIDALGKYVAPGFIDIHSHADDGSGPRGGFRDPDPIRRSAPNLVSQGITTVVVNQDGRSVWPISEQRAQLEKNGIGPNAMLLVGHGTVRRRVMGEDVRRPARPASRAGAVQQASGSWMSLLNGRAATGWRGVRAGSGSSARGRRAATAARSRP